MWAQIASQIEYSLAVAAVMNRTPLNFRCLFPVDQDDFVLATTLFLTVVAIFLALT
jgi:hypothetical protein